MPLPHSRLPRVARRARRLPIAVAALVAALVLTAAPASAGYSGSDPRDLVTVGTRVLFVADDGEHGEELWRTDGTTTSLLKDLNPGFDSSGIDELWKAGSQAFFTAFDGTDLFLWRTNGTPGGTRKISEWTPLDVPVAVGGRIYYAAADVDHGTELWTSDGTVDGTVRLTNLDTGVYPYAMARLGTRVTFAAYGENDPSELWIAGSTAGSVKRIKDFGSTALIDWMVTVGDRVFFELQPVSGTFELWKTDGTKAGTVKVRTLPSVAKEPTAAGTTLFFVASRPTTGPELWRSKGTAKTTGMITDLYPGDTGAEPDFLTAIGSRVFFVAYSRRADDTDDFEIWRSDGTKAGTVMLKNINPGGFPDGYSQAIGLQNVGGILRFYADDGVHGLEPWRSDGTRTGTAMVKDVNPGAAPGYPGGVMGFAKLGTRVYFVADDGQRGAELWRTASGGAKLWANIRPD